MKSLADLLVRISNGILDAINRKNKRDAANDSANYLASGGRVRKSEKSIGDLPEQSRGDSNQ